MHYKIGLLPKIGLLLITLKLMGVLNWEWKWIMFPFWVGPIIFVAFIITMSIMILIKEINNE